MENLELPVGDLVFDAVADGPADGRLVLLLHGFPQTSWSWRLVMPLLVEAGCRVVAPNQRGYSPRARPPDVPAYRMTHLVDDVLGLLTALGADRADVVGHDWGAAVGWQLASRAPDRVRTLAAVSVPHPLAFLAALHDDEDQRSRSQYMKLFAMEGKAEQVLLRDGGSGLRSFFGGAEASADVEHSVALMTQPGVLTACLNWYRAQQRDDFDALGPTRVPTLYVWSDEDLALGPVAAHATAAHVDAAYRFEILHGVSHWVPEQAPGQLATWLLEHLAAHP